MEGKRENILNKHLVNHEIVCATTDNDTQRTGRVQSVSN